MKTKEWFVILWQSEIEYFDNIFELGIYSSIKSYCGNGKTTAPLSIRDIAKRCKISVGKISQTLPLLIDKKVVEIVGEDARSGGAIPVYRCSLGEQLGVRSMNTKDMLGVHDMNTKSTLGVHKKDLGVHISGVGVHDSGTKHDKVKSNKVSEKNENIYLSQYAIWEIAFKNSCDVSEVLNTYWDVLDPENRKKYKIDNTRSRLSSWVRRGISRGTIQTTNDFVALEILKSQEPKPEKANLLVKPEE